MKKTFSLFVLLVVAASLLTGCYWWNQVDSNEVGVVLDDGVSISNIVHAGRYTDSGFYADLVVIDVSNLTISWVDSSLVTKDKQPIGLELKLTFSRSSDSECVKKLYEEYRSEALNNDALISLVTSRVPSPAKALTTQYTLDQMLGIGGDEGTNRLTVESFLLDSLGTELKEICVDLQNAAIADIVVDQSYQDALSAKAAAQIAVEIAKETTKQLEEQLRQERAQTEIDLEIARRENEVNETLAKAFANNPEWFELERLKVLAGVLDAGDLVIFVPEGSDLATVMGTSGVIPIVEP